MGLETGTQIGELVPANPPGTDPKSQADDHLRLIKTCIQGSLGLMDTLYGLKGNNVPLLGETTTPTVYQSLIRLNAINRVDVSQLGVITNILGGANVTGTIVSSGALTVSAGGANITGTLTLPAGGINVTGAVSVLGGNNLAIGSGGNLSIAGGEITLTQTPGGGIESLHITRSGLTSASMIVFENLDASGSAMATCGMFHDDDGDLIVGGVNVGDTRLVLAGNGLHIRMEGLPTSAAGLPDGTLYRAGADPGDLQIAGPPI